MKQGFKIISVMLLVGLLSVMPFMILPEAYSQNVSAITPMATPAPVTNNEAVAFMSNVAELDVARYTVQVNAVNYSGNGFFDEMVKYNLTSGENRARCDLSV